MLFEVLELYNATYSFHKNNVSKESNFLFCFWKVCEFFHCDSFFMENFYWGISILFENEVKIWPHTINPLINARGIYLIFQIWKGGVNKREVFIKKFQCDIPFWIESSFKMRSYEFIANIRTLYDDKIFEKTIYICYMWYVISKSFVSLFLCSLSAENISNKRPFLGFLWYVKIQRNTSISRVGYCEKKNHVVHGNRTSRIQGIIILKNW